MLLIVSQSLVVALKCGFPLITDKSLENAEKNRILNEMVMLLSVVGVATLLITDKGFDPKLPKIETSTVSSASETSKKAGSKKSKKQ